jgi:hypothetical protein
VSIPFLVSGSSVSKSFLSIADPLEFYLRSYFLCLFEERGFCHQCWVAQHRGGGEAGNLWVKQSSSLQSNLSVELFQDCLLFIDPVADGVGMSVIARDLIGNRATCSEGDVAARKW